MSATYSENQEYKKDLIKLLTNNRRVSDSEKLWQDYDYGFKACKRRCSKTVFDFIFVIPSNSTLGGFYVEGLQIDLNQIERCGKTVIDEILNTHNTNIDNLVNTFGENSIWKLAEYIFEHEFAQFEGLTAEYDPNEPTFVVDFCSAWVDSIDSAQKKYDRMKITAFTH